MPVFIFYLWKQQKKCIPIHVICTKKTDYLYYGTMLPPLFSYIHVVLVQERP